MSFVSHNVTFYIEIATLIVDVASCVLCLIYVLKCDTLIKAA